MGKGHAGRLCHEVATSLGLGSSARYPFSPFLGRGFPKIDDRKKGHPYSNLSTGGASPEKSELCFPVLEPETQERKAEDPFLCLDPQVKEPKRKPKPSLLASFLFYIWFCSCLLGCKQPSVFLPTPFGKGASPQKPPYIRGVNSFPC